MPKTTYCIRGNNRQTHKKEIIRDGFRSKEEALDHLKTMAKFYFKTHSYARYSSTCRSRACCTGACRKPDKDSRAHKGTCYSYTYAQS